MLAASLVRSFVRTTVIHGDGEEEVFTATQRAHHPTERKNTAPTESLVESVLLSADRSEELPEKKRNSEIPSGGAIRRSGDLYEGQQCAPYSG